MQEYQRLFSGSKSFYKWKNKGINITDISEDYTKRRGGDISTGGVNISDIDPISGMEEAGTYRCIEVKDEEIESTTLNKDTLRQQFEYSELISVATSIAKDGKSTMSIDVQPSDLYGPDANMQMEDGRPKKIHIAEELIRNKYGQGFL